MGFVTKSFALIASLVMGAGVITGSASATIITYSFDCITNNSIDSANIGTSQLFVDIGPLSPGRVSFTFRNTGPGQCSITDVYMQDGPILGLAQIIEGSGVDFSQGASPANLPGGNLATPQFTATQSFSAESTPPRQLNGVNPGEQVELDYDLISGSTVDDVNNFLLSGALRIGIHVQGFRNGTSESFVNHGTPTPAPGAIAILGVGGLVMVLRRR